MARNVMKKKKKKKKINRRIIDYSSSVYTRELILSWFFELQNVGALYK